jgi:16S rRNA (cytosine967-C5)-methyltransferase
MDSKRNPPLSAREVALTVLSDVDNGPTDDIFSLTFEHSSLSTRDRQLATELVQGTLRHRGIIDYYLKHWFKGDFQHAKLELKNILRLGLYQLLYLDRIPDHAAVNSSVELAKYHLGSKPANLVNAVLRRAIREKDELPELKVRSRIDALAISTSHPLWLVRKWVSRFGWDGAEALCLANNQLPSLWLRWNPLKTNRESFLELLQKSNVEAVPSNISSNHVLIRGKLNLQTWQPFWDGFCTVQDASAGLPVQLLDPKPGETILDFCAAPGGKTTQIAETIGDRGTVLAQDISLERIIKVEENINRLNLNSIHFEVGNGTGLKGKQFDRILLDVPCSGLGVLQRRPDIRWRRKPKDIQTLNRLQRHILEQAIKLTKPNGVIVYSTCTIEPEENIELIDQFLQDHKSWQRDDAGKWFDHSLVNPQGEIETYPHIHNMDGSYAVRLILKSTS